RVLSEVVDGTPPPLRRDRERAVFDKRAGIDELRDILPRGALVGLAPPLDRGRAIFVARERMPLIQFGEIGTDMVEINLGFFRDVVSIELERFEEQAGLALH